MGESLTGIIQPQAFRAAAGLFRQLAARASDPRLSKAYERLADAHEELARWHTIIAEVERDIAALIR